MLMGLGVGWPRACRVPGQTGTQGTPQPLVVVVGGSCTCVVSRPQNMEKRDKRQDRPHLPPLS